MFPVSMCAGCGPHARAGPEGRVIAGLSARISELMRSYCFILSSKQCHNHRADHTQTASVKERANFVHCTSRLWLKYTVGQRTGEFLWFFKGSLLNKGYTVFHIEMGPCMVKYTIYDTFSNNLKNPFTIQGETKRKGAIEFYIEPFHA